MLLRLSNKVKAVAAALATFFAQVGLVLADDDLTFHELSLLKAALVAVGVAAGVYVAPRNSD